MSTLPEGQEADYTGQGVPGYSSRLAELKAARQPANRFSKELLDAVAEANANRLEPLDTLSDLRRLLASIEYGDMMKLSVQLSTMLEPAGTEAHRVAMVLHTWAVTGPVSDSQPSLEPSPAVAQARHQVDAFAASFHPPASAPQARRERREASRAATSPTLRGVAREGEQAGYDDSPGALGM